MLKLLCILCLASPAFAGTDAPKFVGTLSVGVAAYNTTVPVRDTPDIGGTGPAFAAEVGLRLPAWFIEPAISLDVGQYSGTGDDVDDEHYTVRTRPIGLTARVHVRITSFLDINAGIGETLLLEKIVDNAGGRVSDYFDHEWATHVEIGAGVRVWHDDVQAIRLDVLARTGSFSAPEADATITQLRGSIGYQVRF
jgi:hypothetical protein